MATDRQARRQYLSPIEAERYGFRWGQLDVIRNMDYNGIKSLSVLTDHHELQVGVSAKGHSIRIWLDNKPMKLVEDNDEES